MGLGEKKSEVRFECLEGSAGARLAVPMYLRCAFSLVHIGRWRCEAHVPHDRVDVAVVRGSPACIGPMIGNLPNHLKPTATVCAQVQLSAI